MARTRKSGLVLLDTHVVCWLFEGNIKLLSKPASDAIEQGQIGVSPMVKLELEYLYEIGRIKLAADKVLAALHEEIGLQIVDTPFAPLVTQANKLSWTRDPFDRLIVAHAVLANAPLVTRDKLIRDHFPQAVW